VAALLLGRSNVRQWTLSMATSVTSSYQPIASSVTNNNWVSTWLTHYSLLYNAFRAMQHRFILQGSHYVLILKFKDFQGPKSCIFKDQFSMEVYSMDSITAIFNIYFCDYGTVLVDKNKT